MVARRFIDSLWIRRQLVPEAVEIDALAPSDQPLHVGSAEVEMPEQRAADDVVPITDAGQRRIDHDPAGNAVAILRREGVAHHVADVVGDEVGFLDFQMVENARNVDGLIFLRVARVGMRGKPHAAQIRHDHGMIFHQLRRNRRPHVAGITKAVQQDHGGALSTDAYIKTRAVGLDQLRLKARRKRSNTRRYGSRQNQQTQDDAQKSKS